MNPSNRDPFPTVHKLAKECGSTWKSFKRTTKYTANSTNVLREIIRTEVGHGRLLDADSSLVLCGSFARHEMVEGSDCDWSLLINGVVKNQHALIARKIKKAIEHEAQNKKRLSAPGSSGTFGNLVFSHDLVHRIGGGADSNENLTRRILMLLESRPINLNPGDASYQVWEAVLRSILERYFEQDVHFSERRVPRLLLNDLTRYWRTICVDYAAKYREQDGRKWALRNAKIRFSRKLLYASGLAFCFTCHLDPRSPKVTTDFFGSTVDIADPYIHSAVEFARTPPLEYVAKFIDTFVKNEKLRTNISQDIFGAYDDWLDILGDRSSREKLERLGHTEARNNRIFKEIRKLSIKFANGLNLLYFNRTTDKSKIAKLSLEYVAF